MSTAGTFGTVVIASQVIPDLNVSAVSAGSLLSAYVQRFGSNAGDPLANDAAFLGLMIKKRT